MTVDRDGPVLIEGPVEVVAEDGTAVVSDRFVVAICTCRRSRTYPWCDTSHRAHQKAAPDAVHHAPGKQQDASGERQGEGEQGRPRSRGHR
ncbi:CDGSH iron-sulfur domain-containing protein [Actinacidiphila rubida]|uniref:CDGSH iron-sulfur domain-containing protein n=1 Tax=Actinacidiphila rubida TaxID=310780 RepID=UPI00084971FB|nr:CDGSH iron-sulfur domain-containing protein [Actinacidiphila rubida]